ncbi:TPA: hypothetical protein EYP37_03175 [Candidatus Poribacteria bacterium]|nr:hypothetical protein [Candidatus Poribacteria bacterium]
MPGNWVVRRLIAMFTHIDISVLNRLAMWYYTCNMIGARWLFGWGVGCYPLAYPQFVPVDGVRMIFLHPHNWYLHLSAEMGIVGATFWFAFIIMALAIGWQRLKADADARNSNGIAQLYRLAAWSGCIGFMVGSVSNSEWEIPAIMIAFFTLLAIASGGAYPASAHQRGEGQLSILRNHSSAFARMMQWCIGVTIGLLFATTVIRWDIANFAFALGIAQRNTVQGIKWLQRASRWDSRNAYYHAQLALISFRTLNDGLTARRHYRRALKCYPYDGVYYHNLAWLHLLDWRDAVGSWNITAISIPSHKRERAVSAGMRAVAYFRKALRYDPANPRYRTCLLIAQALAEEARGDIGRATELCKRALKADWFPAWLPNHTAKLLRAEGRFSEANRLARLHRGAQSKHLGANGLPFRYHLPVRYRRIGVVDEAIVIEH